MSQKKSKTLLYVCLAAFLLNISHDTKPEPNTLGWDPDKQYINFETSMQLENYLRSIAITEKITEVNGVELYKFFRKIYEKNNLSKVMPKKEPKIPKIIHVVWLNGKIDDPSVPQELKKYIVTWIQKHPDWEFRLWTDAEVAQITLDNQDLYDDTINFGVKSDILKYEIVYRYGGVYVDTDFECLRPLDILHHCYDFYVGIQPLDSQYLQLGAALFGAKPGHPILKHVIDTMNKSYYSHEGAPAKTGPIHFTRAMFDIAEKIEDTIDIAFPASYFYPFGAQEKVAERKRWEDVGAFAIHWWGMTWMPSKYRKKNFKTIKNEELVKDWNK